MKLWDDDLTRARDIARTARRAGAPMKNSGRRSVSVSAVIRAIMPRRGGGVGEGHGLINARTGGVTACPDTARNNSQGGRL